MNLTLGVAAHVDAGKTTLCEQLLRHAGVIRACGRVDHGDAFMDDDPMERARGITIFTEQATLAWPVSGDEPLLVTLDPLDHQLHPQVVHHADQPLQQQAILHVLGNMQDEGAILTRSIG